MFYRCCLISEALGWEVFWACLYLVRELRHRGVLVAMGCGGVPWGLCSEHHTPEG